MNAKRSRLFRRIAATSTLAIGMTLGVVATSTTSSHAAYPSCVNDGAHVVFARGSEAPFNSNQSNAFRSQITGALNAAGITTAWAELGNLDDQDFNPTKEYPAVGPADWGILSGMGGYHASVSIGSLELTNYLNNRYASGACPTETLVLGGYSQGAEVVGYALTGLSDAARRHIGYVALYGDPRFNPGSLSQRQQWQRPVWVRGDDPGFRYRWSASGEIAVSNAGILGARLEYVPGYLQNPNRLGSWCAYLDGICTGSKADNGGDGTHNSAYQGHWIAASAQEIVDRAKEKRAALVGSSGSSHPISLPANAQASSIIESDQNHLYVYAGGRLFWFDRNDGSKLDAFKAQARQLTGSDTFIPLHHAAVHAIEVNRTNTGAYAPGSHMPADNTFLLEYGSPTQYVIKFQRPFAIGDTAEVTALGGANRAVMVPTSISDLMQHPAQWVQNDLLQFYGDPSVWHYAHDRGFRVTDVPTRDCLSVRWHRGVTLMPASAWNYFPTHATQLAACDFTHGQVLVGQPSQRQVMVLYGAGFAIGSPEEAVAIGAAGWAVPVTDLTVDGLMARTPSVPQGHVFRAGLQTQAYHYVDGKFHPIGSPATRDCLLARDGLGTGEEIVPGSFIARYPASTTQAYCELENRQLLASNGVTVGYVKDGYRRPVTNPTIRDCIAVRTGAGQPLPVSDNVWNSYTPGPNAYCPYEMTNGLNFVQEAGSPTVWLVGPGTGGGPGVKRHVGSLCVPDPHTTQLTEYRVWTVPAGETAGHVQGADWWATPEGCQGLPKG